MTGFKQSTSLIDDVESDLVGFDHEPAIKERLQKIAFETKIYRREYRMHAQIVELGDNRAKLNLTLEYKVKNVSPEPVEYQHKMSCDEFEHPEFFSMSMTSVGDPQIAKRAGKMQVVIGADSEERGVWYSCLKKVSLKPRTEYDCRTKCSVTFPRNHFFSLNTSHPTMGIRLEVDAPEGCEVFPSKTDYHDGNELSPTLYDTRAHLASMEVRQMIEKFEPMQLIRGPLHLPSLRASPGRFPPRPAKDGLKGVPASASCT